MGENARGHPENPIPPVAGLRLRSATAILEMGRQGSRPVFRMGGFGNH
jgi:hypothetical protein